MGTCPHRLQAASEVKKLAMLYGEYERHLDLLKQYSGMLWAEMDMAQLTAAADEAVRRLHGMVALQPLPTYGFVEQELLGFQASLPLIHLSFLPDAVGFPAGYLPR